MLLRKSLILLGLLLSTLALSYSSSAQVPSKTVAEDVKSKDVKKNAVKAIKDRRHPDYVRCRKEPIIGSLSKKRKICMTNQQWKVHIREGNKRAHEFRDQSMSGATTGE